MAARIFFTCLALISALAAFCDGAASSAGSPNLFGILFLFVAIIVWYEWPTVHDGFTDRIDFMFVRLGPLIAKPGRRRPAGKP